MICDELELHTSADQKVTQPIARPQELWDMHSEKLEPEIYASPDERPPQNQSDAIQDFHGRGDAADPPNDLFDGNLNALLRGVASPSLNEIDRLIHDLENVREILCREGERITREIIDYASA